MSPSLRRLVLVLAVAALAGGGLLATPASAQCLSEAECSAIKAQLMDLRQDAQPLREQLRALRADFQATAPGSPERQALKARARVLRQQVKQLKMDARPLRRSYRQNCKNC